MEHREVGYLMSRIHAVTHRIFNKLLDQAQIKAFTAEQGKFLYILWQQDGLPLSELAQRSQLALNTVSQMITTMERVGLVRREPSKQDKRVKIIWLTAVGHQLRKETDAISSHMESIVYGDMTDEERRTLDQLLKQVLHNVSAYERQEVGK